MDEIFRKSNKKMISKQGNEQIFLDDFHALFGYIWGKYRLPKKLCSNYRPEQAGPSSGVKLDLKQVLEKTLSQSRPFDTSNHDTFCTI